MRLCITGAGGWLAGEIIERLVAKGMGDSVVAVSSDPSKVDSRVGIRLGSENFVGGFELDGDCIVIHCAFCRRSDGAGLAESLRYSEAVFAKAAREGARGIVNVSSQSVYGPAGTRPSREEDAPAPTYLYSMAKLSSEIVLRAASDAGEVHVPYSNLRLASLIGANDKSVNENVLFHFVEKAMSGESIAIVGGDQVFSFLDIRDGADAVIRFAYSDPSEWRDAYNVGPMRPIGIADLARIADGAVRGLGYGGAASVDVIPGDESAPVRTMIDSAAFRAETGWSPRCDISETAEEIARWIERHER